MGKNKKPQLNQLWFFVALPAIPLTGPAYLLGDLLDQVRQRNL